MSVRVPINWPLGKLLKGWATLQENITATAITGLSLDGRLTHKGDLFFALQGLQQHGLKYSQQAITNGASAVAWEVSELIGENDLSNSIPHVAIDDLQNKLGLICQRFYHNPSAEMNVIAVTGTDGKTSVSQFISQALHQLKQPCGVIGTLGYGIYPDFSQASHTTPDAVRMHGLLHDFTLNKINHVVVEASSHGLSQGRLNGVEVDTAVFTNLGRDHMDYHQSIDDYFKAKRLLFLSPKLKNAVLNIDDEAGAQLADEFSNSLQLISYSINSNKTHAGSYINAENIKSVNGGTHFEIDSSWGKAEVTTRLIGKFNISNLLAVAGALLASEIEFEKVIKIIAAIQTVPGRMEFITPVINSDENTLPVVVVDYAHTPQALINVLKVLREQCDGKLWCVFGCGGNRDQGKRKLMAEAVEKYADVAVVTDDNPRFEDPEKITNEIVSGFSSTFSGSPNYSLIHDRKQAIEYAIKHARAKDFVLIAGKGHEAVQIINHDHLPFDDKKIAREVLR